MATELYLSFRPMGMGAERSVQSLVGLRQDGAFSTLLSIDLAASALLAADSFSWTMKPQEGRLVQLDSFPEDELTAALSEHIDPLDALMAMREIELRWDAFAEELLAKVTELQTAGEDTYSFLSCRPLHALAKAHTGPVEWTP